MGTVYNFVCKTCKENYDIDKIYNACRFIPKLEELHKGHEYGIYSEHQDSCEDYFEPSFENDFKCEYKGIDAFKVFKYTEGNKELSMQEFTDYHNEHNAEKLIE